MEHEIPTRLACHGSSEVVSVSKANFPASYILLMSTCNASSLFTIIVLVFFALPSSISRKGASCGSLETLGRRNLRTTSWLASGMLKRSSCTGPGVVGARFIVPSSSSLSEVMNCVSEPTEPGGGGGVRIGTMPRGGASSKSSSCSGTGSCFLREAGAEAAAALSCSLPLAVLLVPSPGGAIPRSRKSASTLSTIVRNSNSRKISSTLSRFKFSMRQASRSSCTGASSTIVARNLLSFACSLFSPISFCSFGFNSWRCARTPSKLP